MQDLLNKRVVVTGGASGIGLATVRHFHAEGARVGVLDHNTKSMEQLKGELPDLTKFLITDVANYESVVEAFSELEEAFQGLDILINNAGVSHRKAFIDVSPEEWKHVLSVNLTGAFYVAQQATRAMMKSGGGVIINMGSTNGIIGYPKYAAYNVSKAGLIELTRTMALELAPDIRVVAVCPGYVMTPMQQAEYSEEMIAEVNAKIPLGRHAQPDEVVSLIAFLASDEASFLTGHTYIIDGGEITGGLASR
jgi:NAD(P)-dependent dehydrogenase (short-subunit alcohol dehydrogenase family)